MQKLWIDGRETALTPREEVRLHLFAGGTMNRAEQARRNALMSAAAFARIERLWIQGTATEHPRTRAWPLARWSARRERIRAAVRGYLARERLAA
jgi:hypothetical protein